MFCEKSVGSADLYRRVTEYKSSSIDVVDEKRQKRGRKVGGKVAWCCLLMRIKKG